MLRYLEEKAFIFPSGVRQPPNLGQESVRGSQSHQPRHSLGEFWRLQKRCKPNPMYCFERTRDYSLLQALMTSDRRIWSGMSDDTCPSMEDFRLPEDDSVWYVLVRDEEKLMGFWALIPKEQNCAEVHTVIIPAYWGSAARRAAREMGDWIWSSTPFTRLTTTVPAWHRTALAFAKVSGMKESGVQKEKQMKRGKLHDLICLEMHRPGV